MATHCSILPREFHGQRSLQENIYMIYKENMSIFGGRVLKNFFFHVEIYFFFF